ARADRHPPARPDQAGNAVGGGPSDACRHPPPLPPGGDRPGAGGAGRHPRRDAATADRRGERLMARHRDDGTTPPDETAPQGAAIDDDPILDRPDPLGLGGTPPPDAPSRSPKPRIVALLGEFFRMSRTTAILL